MAACGDWRQLRANCATRHREEARIGIHIHVLHAVVGQAYLRGHQKVGAVSVVRLGVRQNHATVLFRGLESNILGPKFTNRRVG